MHSTQGVFAALCERPDADHLQWLSRELNGLFELRRAALPLAEHYTDGAKLAKVSGTTDLLNQLQYINAKQWFWFQIETRDPSLEQKSQRVTILHATPK